MLAVSRKTCSGATFLKDFGVVLGAEDGHVGDFGGTMALFSAAGCGVVVGVMEIVAPQAKTGSSQRSKSI